MTDFWKIVVKATMHGFDVSLEKIRTDLRFLQAAGREYLNTINTNRLCAYEPELSVYISNPGEIDEYIQEMKKIIQKSLVEKLAYYDLLVDVCQ